MTNAVVLIEACTVCNRVQRTYLARRSRRKTPLVCADCRDEKQESSPSAKQARSGDRRRR